MGSRTRTRPSDRRRIGVGVGVAALLAVAACGDDAADPGAPGDVVPEVPDGMVHVHGLGVNPADDQVYVATHYGLFRLDGAGEAVRLGEVQDLMGFTVVGEDHFVASGHPGARMMQEGVENPLGLIESDDGGDSWEAVSLSGEVDFHALTYAHDTIYGWNATGGELLVSSDGDDWDERARLPMMSLAVDPDDPDRLVAALPPPEGLGISTDGGVTWETQTDQVEDLDLVWLSWDADGGLWAAAAEGELYRIDDPEDGTWEHVGSVEGIPMALHVEGDAVYAASMLPDVGANEIVVSTDGAETWDVLYHGE